MKVYHEGQRNKKEFSENKEIKWKKKHSAIDNSIKSIKSQFCMLCSKFRAQSTQHATCVIYKTQKRNKIIIIKHIYYSIICHSPNSLYFFLSSIWFFLFFIVACTNFRFSLWYKIQKRKFFFFTFVMACIQRHGTRRTNNT